MSREDSVESAAHPLAGDTQVFGSAESAPGQQAAGDRAEIRNVLAQMNTILERQNEILSGQHKTQNLVERFLKLNPPKFDGSRKLEDAEKWVFRMVKIFDFLRCNDEDKLTMASYQLEDNVMHWWRANKPLVFPAGKEMVWSAFVIAFYDKFFSKVARDKNESEFVELKQGKVTVDQYEAKFSELSRFAPKLVVDAEDKAKRFLKGLKPDIKKQLLPFGPMSYGELYSRAQYIKQGMMEEKEDKKEDKEFEQGSQGDGSKGKRPMYYGKKSFTPSKRPFGRSSSHSSRRSSNYLGQRSVNQPGAGPMSERRCFRCGQAGHVVRDCPDRKGSFPIPSSQGS